MIDIHFFDRESESALGFLEHLHRLLATAALVARVDRECEVRAFRVSGRRRRRLTSDVIAVLRV